MEDELKLPELPESYRWRIEKSEFKARYDSVTIYLEKRIQHWWGNNWQPLQSEFLSRTANSGLLTAAVNRRAEEMYNLEFNKTDAGRIAGIYGDN